MTPSSRTILLTFLGDSPYRPIRYYLQNKAAALEVHYVQEALVELLYQEAAVAMDAVYCFVTKEAKQYNWDHRCVGKRKMDQGFDYQLEAGKGLAYVLEQQAGCTGQLHPVDIETVQKETDIWALFARIEAVVQVGDQVILDITNGFRFMPMLGMVLLNYLKVTKGIVVKGIYYGNFEAREDGVAPLMELTQLAALQDWTNATHSFVAHGVSKALVQLIQDEVLPYLKEAETRQEGQPFRYFAQRLNALTEALQTNRGTDLVQGKLFEQLDNSMAQISGSILIPPLQPLLQLVQAKTQPFARVEDWRNGLQAVDWCIQHNLTQQGITMLQETIVTYLCIKMGLDYTTRHGRQVVSDILNHNILLRQNPSTQQLAQHYQMTTPFLSNELLAVYNSLTSGARNDINHGGFSSNANPQRLKNNLSANFKVIKTLLLEGNVTLYP